MKKKIILTTADLKNEYEIIDIITVHKRLTQPKILNQIVIGKVNSMLKDEAQILDADAVIGIGYSMERTTTGASILGFGTAVKFKEAS